MKIFIYILIFIPLSCYSQINWNEVNQDFQQSLKEIAQDRQNERYRLDRIADDAKQNIMNQYLISDVSGLSNIFNDAQMVAMEDVDRFHTFLKNGTLKHRSFEPAINYIQQLIATYKMILSDIDRQVSRKSTVMSNIEFDILIDNMNAYISLFKIHPAYFKVGKKRFVIKVYRIKIGEMEMYEFVRNFNSKYDL